MEIDIKLIKYVMETIIQLHKDKLETKWKQTTDIDRNVIYSIYRNVIVHNTRTLLNYFMKMVGK